MEYNSGSNHARNFWQNRTSMKRKANLKLWHEHDYSLNYKTRDPVTNYLYLQQILALKMSFENFFWVKMSVALFLKLKSVENVAKEAINAWVIDVKIMWVSIASNPHFSNITITWAKSRSLSSIKRCNSQTLQIFKPIFISLGGSKTNDSTVINRSCYPWQYYHCTCKLVTELDKKKEI